ncbi:hypothetical protein [Pseudarthrobacter phenanthrenivorans]|uniref:hypothetical protein n=1 Tax=Pseudarthrobacter phenanthrenivorans TaxID=361575 RepID=UPI002F359C78
MDSSQVIDSRHALIRSNNELTSGETVEAYYKGSLVHRGEVSDIAPNQELFWMMDVLTGHRKLVDIAELDVVRGKAPAPRDSRSYFTLPR